MKLLLSLAWAAAIVLAQSSSPETPLSNLPYSASLDVSSMDRSADPCTDFYRYSCGGWIKKNPIPPDQSRWDVYQKLTEDNLRFLWGILQEVSQPSAGRTAVEAQIGDFFYACMDEGAVETAGAAPLKPALDRIAALKSIADLPAYLAAQHLRGAMMMFDFGSNQHSSRVKKTPSRSTILLFHARSLLTLRS